MELQPTYVPVATGIGAAVLALAFLVVSNVSRVEHASGRSREWASIASGMSAAYVFLHLIPELADARQEFAEAAGRRARFEGQLVYYTALAGFLLAYGMERMRQATVDAGRVAGADMGRVESRAFWIHVGGFCAYSALVTFLLARTDWHTWVQMLLYVVAVGGHFLAVAHALHEEHGAAYQRLGRWLLGGACVLGWSAGVQWQIPQLALSLVVAWLSGAVIMNSTILELAPNRPGRLLPFLAGGLGYGLMLVPLG